MPGGGGSNTTTQQQSQKTEPWAPAVPALNEILGGATKAYQSGVGSQVYGGQRVAGLGSDTLAGLDMLKDAATTGSATAGAANDLVGGLARSGGTTAATQQAVAGFGAINPTVSTAGVGSAVAKLSDPSNIASTTGAKMAGGAYATDTAPVAGLAGDFATGTSQTQRSLQDVADGKFLGGANPYLDEIISRSGNEAATKVAQAFSASGRYGSGRFAGATADAVAGIGSKLRYDDYEAERGRQASAASAIDAAGNARAGLAGSLLSTVAGVGAQNANIAATGANLSQGAARDALAGEQALASLRGSNVDRSLTQANALVSAAQADRAAGLAAVSQAPTILDVLERSGKTTAAVGALQDADAQARLDAERALFDEQQASPWKQLGLYGGLVSPIASAGSQGEGTTKTTTPQPGLLNTILGGAVGLSGAAANLGKAVPFFSMLSDERAKEDIQPVGALHDGQTVYSYRYKGDPTPQIGLLAQEVAERNPEAVAMRPDGMLAVDYGRATAPAAGLAGAALSQGEEFRPRDFPGLIRMRMAIENDPARRTAR